MKKESFISNIFLCAANIIVVLLAVLFTILAVFLFKSNIFPLKYLLLFMLITIFIVLFLSLILCKKRYLWLRIIVCVFGGLIGFISVMAIIYLNNTFNFISSLTVKEVEGINYNVVVLKSINYTDINNLKNETIGMLDENSDNVIKSLSEKIIFNDSIVKEAGSLLEGLYNYKYKAIVVDNDILEMIKEDKTEFNFDDVAKVLYTFSVETKVSNKKGQAITIDDRPFALYISGIDQYGAINTVRGRSDVNIIAIVNPKTYKILLINTPRDYYVQLHGKEGLKDKLTHAGVYGIDLSVATLEDLYNVNIDYYLRINFDTLVNVVDVIGGIDVYSDITFNSSHIKGWVVQSGVNHLDGAKALAYSRERYAYLTGDRHRGQNQQDVISAIIKKTSSSKVLLTKYNDILNSLANSFQTNMPTETIKSFIRYQLDKMPTWEIDTVNVSGADAYDYTYSYGTRLKLYVMVPFEKDINDAKLKISGVISGR